MQNSMTAQCQNNREPSTHTKITKFPRRKFWLIATFTAILIVIAIKFNLITPIFSIDPLN